LKQTNPDISIVVITKNDPMAPTLAGLKRLRYPGRIDVTVVDASGPGIIDGVRADYPDVNWIYYLTQTASESRMSKKRSVGGQRNLGVRAAKSNVIAFIDTNCVPDADWLVHLVAPIVSGEEAITAGATLAANPKTLANFNPTDPQTKYREGAPTANLAFTRELFDLVGGFDETLQFGSDIDFTWRCTDAGYRIRNVPEARITHDWGDVKDELTRSFKYGRAKLVLYTKHPQRVKPFREDMFVPMYLSYMLLMPLTLVFPWYPLTIALPMLRNLRKRPFKTALINFVFSIGFASEGITRSWIILRKRLV
jgi:glycosyltransferase involved in cell wall biosynthesis